VAFQVFSSLLLGITCGGKTSIGVDTAKVRVSAWCTVAYRDMRAWLMLAARDEARRIAIIVAGATRKQSCPDGEAV
jgi:hypothetical protein